VTRQETAPGAKCDIGDCLFEYAIAKNTRPPIADEYGRITYLSLFSALNGLADCARCVFWEISTCQISTGTYLCILETTCIRLLLSLFVKMD